MHGPNELARGEDASSWTQVLAHFKSPLVALLLGAAVIAGALGEVLDAVVIGVILVLNAVVSYVQEHRAERALLALRTLTAPRARVLRDGRAEVIRAREVVPGDLVLLEGGDLVPADARLLEASELLVVEASLTGESLPVSKSTAEVSPDAPLAERTDRVFLGTAVAKGSGLAEVTATGMATEMGRIAHLLETASSGPTPLERHLAGVGRLLLAACLSIVAVVFLLGILRGDPVLEVLLASLSLAVAAVPEGLPVIVTIALAVGVQRLAARRVLVRRLAAVETLGCTTVICTDKTGTLTTGVMTLRETWGPDEDRLLHSAASCCDAELGPDGEGGTGDPTELALLRAARERGIRREVIERENPRRRTWPFDADVARMSVLREDGVLHVKGALEALLPHCVEGMEGATEAADDLAARGLRVIAVATGEGESAHGGPLRLLGLVGLADPPRPEATLAIEEARRAGVRTVMITGDNRLTARAIAREMGLLRDGDDEADVVHARATPEEKLRTVRDWKARGAVVAMTGDGVNDAPALQEAHVGIAMGITGTEVTRGAADLVLANDDYASIVAGVREGRGVHDNVRKTLVYLLTGNAGELLVMLGAALLGLPLPLSALQVLWVNLVTDGLPALALVMDHPEKDVLRRPPRPLAAPMLGRPEWRRIIGVGLLDAAVVLSVFLTALELRTLEEARSLAFATLVFAELLRAFGARSPTRTFWEVGALTNLRLLAVIAGSVALQVSLHALPFTREVLGLAPLSSGDLGACFLAGLVPVSVIEVSKLAGRFFARARG